MTPVLLAPSNICGRARVPTTPAITPAPPCSQSIGRPRPAGFGRLRRCMILFGLVRRRRPALLRFAVAYVFLRLLRVLATDLLLCAGLPAAHDRIMGVGLRRRLTVDFRRLRR